MNAAITIEDLLGAEGWDDAVHPSRLAAETEFLLAESMQAVLLDMRARFLRAGNPQAGEGAVAARDLAEAQRGLNYLSLIQARLVRTYRADASFDEARDGARVEHRNRLRTFAMAAIVANRPEAKKAGDARAEVEKRLARISAVFQAAAGGADECDACAAREATALRDRDLSEAPDDSAQTALRMPPDGENVETALRMDEALPDDLETKSAVSGLEYGAVVPWGWRPPQRQRGGQPGNRNRFKTGRFTAEAKAQRAQSRTFRRGLRELGALVKQVIALRYQGSGPVPPPGLLAARNRSALTPGRPRPTSRALVGTHST